MRILGRLAALIVFGVCVVLTIPLVLWLAGVVVASTLAARLVAPTVARPLPDDGSDEDEWLARQR